ncbi:mannosyltransferase [Gramella sp. GC03-9]|uniref:Mannosyltransferase n=1 Tax=Christiangramia oceanisediminis TaxID=2920386 RepID=A0A9X2KW36_9FLAO|nr:mannosyltransferase [Gramella oceanisediminis]MCP9198884.1 mannosyltransferase [Gramella oceanisediminis]
MDFQKLSLYKYPIIFSLSCTALYLAFAYDLERSDFFKLISLYGALFFLSFKLIQFQKHNYWVLISLSLVFRLLFIVAIPMLSQDYFRFIWDGRLLANGFNPYEYLPAELVADPTLPVSQARQLIDGMGGLSAANYTNYAPVNQLVFLFAGGLAGNNIIFSVILMRIVIIAADFGTLYFGTQLLRSLKLPDHRIFWYMLNPFIIIELTGNLHFEGVMVFFLVWALYLLHKRKWIWSAIVFGISVSVKLLPLMFLPLLFRYFTGFSFPGISKASAAFSQANENFSGKKKNGLKEKHPQKDKSRSPELNISTRHPERSRGQSISHSERSRGKSISHPERSRGVIAFSKLIVYYLLVFAVVILSFFPFFNSEVIRNFTQSIGLWFGKFEFNASIYYVVREFGFWIKGYNIIGSAGKILPLITLLIILGLSFFRKNQTTKQLITSMLFAITAYLFLSTTVHPWYLAVPLILSVFTQFRYMIAWSAVVFLSYYAYSNPEYQENLWLVTLEYLIVFGYMGWELFKGRPLKL